MSKLHLLVAIFSFKNWLVKTLAIIFFSFSLTTIAASTEEISGELDVIHKDDFDGHSHLENDYFIREDNGINWHQLYFDRQPPGHLKSGQRIKIKGQHKEGKFHVESLEEETIVKNKANQNTDFSI